MSQFKWRGLVCRPVADEERLRNFGLMKRVRVPRLLLLAVATAACVACASSTEAGSSALVGRYALTSWNDTTVPGYLGVFSEEPFGNTGVVDSLFFLPSSLTLNEDSTWSSVVKLWIAKVKGGVLIDAHEESSISGGRWTVARDTIFFTRDSDKKKSHGVRNGRTLTCLRVDTIRDYTGAIDRITQSLEVYSKQ